MTRDAMYAMVSGTKYAPGAKKMARNATHPVVANAYNMMCAADTSNDPCGGAIPCTRQNAQPRADTATHG